MGRRVFVTGGARSGKSRFAQDIACRSSYPVLFVATAESLDDEMSRRIAKHRQHRPREWVTLEAPKRIASNIEQHVDGSMTVLVDCLSLYVSNLLLDSTAECSEECVEQAILKDISDLLRLLERAAEAVVVSNEVGLSIVPENALARLYRDILGRVNQAVALWADEAYFVVSGIPMSLKGGTMRR